MTDSIPKPIQHLSVEEAAAAIISLINASPRSPWPSEIETIVAKVAVPASPPAHDEALAVDHATWRKLVLEAEATLRAKDLKCGDPLLPAAEAVSEAAYERLHAFEAAIWERPARSVGDLHFLADLLVYQMWPGYALTEAFPGNDPVDFNALFEEGANCQGGTVDTATAALLRAIRDLRLAPQQRAASPSCEVPPQTLAAFREYQRIVRAEVAFFASDWNPREDETRDAAYDLLHKEECACKAKIWAMPVQGWADVLLRAFVYANTGDEFADGVWLYTDAKRLEDDHPEHCMPFNDTRARAFVFDAIFKAANLSLPDILRDPENPEVPIVFLEHMARIEFPGGGAHDTRPRATDRAPDRGP